MTPEHLAGWYDAQTSVVVRATVTLPFDKCKIKNIGEHGLSVMSNGRPYWLPYASIMFITEFREGETFSTMNIDKTNRERKS